jgi:lipopolysaccharide export LptBFGC system permease protein LptF
MTVPMMLKKINSYEKRLNIVSNRLSGNFYRTIGDSILPSSIEQGKQFIENNLYKIRKDTTLTKVQIIKKEKRLKNLERQINNEFNLIKSYKKSKNKYEVEIHKKFSIPVACILFVLLGAPLGVMSKKGGFAVSTSLSFGFFLIYYVLLIGGEEMADRNILSPPVGMWTPNLIILLIVFYLLVHIIRETAPIEIKIPMIFKKEKI